MKRIAKGIGLVGVLGLTTTVVQGQGCVYADHYHNYSDAYYNYHNAYHNFFYHNGFWRR